MLLQYHFIPACLLLLNLIVPHTGNLAPSKKPHQAQPPTGSTLQIRRFSYCVKKCNNKLIFPSAQYEAPSNQKRLAYFPGRPYATALLAWRMDIPGEIPSTYTQKVKHKALVLSYAGIPKKPGLVNPVSEAWVTSPAGQSPWEFIGGLRCTLSLSPNKVLLIHKSSPFLLKRPPGGEWRISRYTHPADCAIPSLKHTPAYSSIAPYASTRFFDLLISTVDTQSRESEKWDERAGKAESNPVYLNRRFYLTARCGSCSGEPETTTLWLWDKKTNKVVLDRLLKARQLDFQYQSLWNNTLIAKANPISTSKDRPFFYEFIFTFPNSKKGGKTPGPLR